METNKSFTEDTINSENSNNSNSFSLSSGSLADATNLDFDQRDDSYIQIFPKVI